ncbi:EpsI family protein [Methylonatrum kenyense]|uniref:exosortase C-terminal domain/associated protein EpsI n=1 Tax=Methylonatrum kenyense TaxID=455253 RepID=UPI0020C168F0|nr:exosortase C-terminal domain/associated protein EpsI [Methylonatrum kenyense]MCK8516775.1 EpsI family protein [Methylonatrum kenyense]
MSATTMQGRAAPIWRRTDGLVAFGTLVLVVASFPYPAELLLNRWLRFDEAYSHGLLVLAISTFLVTRSLVQSGPFRIRPNAAGILLAAVLAVGIGLAAMINVMVLQQIGLVLLWWACILALLGIRGGAAFAVPVGILLYAVPFWDYLALPLQLLATEINTVLLGLRGIHFEVEGVYIHLLDIGTFEIAHGCSGLRYLIVGLTLATLFSALNLSRIRDWIALHATAVALALVVNWARIFTIILVGYETEMQSSLISQHELFGWILFALALIPFFLFARWLAGEREADAGTSRNLIPRNASHWSRAACGVLVLAAVVWIPALYLTGAEKAAEVRPLTAPAQLADREQMPGATPGPWSPDMHRADQVLRTAYRGGSRLNTTIHLGIWLYAPQRQGHELVQYGNRLVDPDEWIIEHRETGPIDGWSIMTLRHRHLDQSHALAAGYAVAGNWTSGPLAIKAQMLRGALSGRRDGALVSLDMRCSATDCAAEKQLLASTLEGETLTVLENLLTGSAR